MGSESESEREKNAPAIINNKLISETVREIALTLNHEEEKEDEQLK